MFRYILCAAMFAVLFGCVEEYIDPALLESVEEFEVRYDTQIDFGVYFDKGLPTAGNCFKGLFGREVTINPTWWENTSDPLMRRAMVFHELGHCRFDLPHDNRRDEKGLKISLMHKEPPHPGGYLDWNQLKKELESKISR